MPLQYANVKTLRFCAKMWSNLSPSINERYLITSTKAVVFPHPIRQQTSLRISIELSPDNKRLAKRSEKMRFTLVYRCGVDDAGGPHEEVRLTNFRRFLEALPSVVRSNRPADAGALTITSMVVTCLDEPDN